MTTNVPGGWVIAKMQPATLPEEVQSAFSQVTSSMVGATYVPVLYCGYQVVQGTNHMIICEQTLAAQGAPKHLIKMVINIFQHNASIVGIETIL